MMRNNQEVFFVTCYFIYYIPQKFKLNFYKGKQSTQLKKIIYQKNILAFHHFLNNRVKELKSYLRDVPNRYGIVGYYTSFMICQGGC
ncbi:unnamed protein product [Paramecium octaurelia]|uniref:Uncharacterized protein n=1 Tax=Paramecium octaurelia TaxID=43137 RepID=A0A8S1XJ56_PAROT|nr:unnamed protein product [Paramecium octaurelia]CAD8201211.1 unnamed protein product [Paramecium octaurelia]